MTAAPALVPDTLVVAPSNGFTTVYGITFNPMAILLGGAVVAIIVLIYFAHRSGRFNLWDLVREDGKPSLTRVAFISAFIMTTWIVIDKEIKSTLDVAFFATYLAAWVAPLTAKIVFNRSEPPKVTP